MRFVFTLVLFAAFWSGMAGQELPFDVEVEDLNLKSGRQQMRFFFSDHRMYSVNSLNCLYSGTWDGKNFTLLHCNPKNTNLYYSFNEAGAFASQRSPEDGSYTLYFFDRDNRRSEVFTAKEPIRRVSKLSNGDLLFVSGTGLYRVDSDGRNSTLLMEAEERIAYCEASVQTEATVLIINLNLVYVTDGTVAGTAKAQVEPGPYNFLNLDRAGDKVFLQDGRTFNLWQIDLQKPGAAEKVWDFAGKDARGFKSNDFFVVREKLMASVYERAENKTYLYAYVDGVFQPVADPNTNQKYEVRRLQHTSGQHLIFKGGHGSVFGMYASDGTAEGTRLLVNWRYQSGFSWWDVSSFRQLSEDVFAFVGEEYQREGNYRLFVMDLARDVTKDWQQSNWASVFLSHLVLKDQFVLSFGTSSLLVDRTTLDISEYGRDLSAAYSKTRGEDFTYFLDSDGYQEPAWNITSIHHVTAEMETFNLPAGPDGEPQFVDRLVERAGKVYAVAVTASLEYRLYLLNGGEESIRFVGDLPSNPHHSDIRAMYINADDELNFETGGGFYHYHDSELTPLGPGGGLFLSRGYAGQVNGVDIYYHTNTVIIPALGKTGFFNYPRRTTTNGISPFVVGGDEFFALTYGIEGPDSSSVTTLFSGDMSIAGRMDTVTSYQFEGHTNAYRPVLNAVGNKLYFAVPQHTGGGEIEALWYSLDTESGVSGPAAELSGENHALGRTVTFDGDLYFVSDRNGPARVMRLKDEGTVEEVVRVADGEELVEVMTLDGSLLVMTDYHITSLDLGKTLAEAPAGKQFEQMRNVGGELFVEMSDADGLGFYTYHRGSGRFVPLATGFQFPEDRQATRREARSNAVIGNNVMFRGTKGEYYYYLLYNTKKQQLIELGSMDKYLVQGYAGPLGMGYEGRYYYLFMDPELGLELHHFRPPFSHTLKGTVTDANGQPVRNRRVKAVGREGISTFTDSVGRYTLYLDSEQEYTVGVAADACFAPVEAVTVATDAGETTELYQDFTLRGSEGRTGLSPFLASGPARCGFTVPFWLTVSNDGCTPQSGEVRLTLHEDAELVIADQEPDEIKDGTLIWTFSDLAPGQRQQFHLQLRMPDETYAGQPIEMPVTTLTADADGNEVRDTFLYDDLLRCAIDPNDKRSWPSRPEETNSNYTQLDEEITYMIRFQNTGNDTALTVLLEDQLSDQLDYGTFRKIDASHECRIGLSDGGLLEVFFDDIYLPDSTTNEPASHGFFTFGIRVRDSLADYTTIENTAGIYFDFNQPVITNTTKNTMLETLDADADGYFFFDECDDTNAAINPGVTDTPGNGVDENCDGVDGTNAVRDFGTTVLEVAPNPTRNKLRIRLADDLEVAYALFGVDGRGLRQGRFRREAELSLVDLPAGLYVLRLTDSRGGVASLRVVKQ